MTAFGSPARAVEFQRGRLVQVGLVFLMIVSLLAGVPGTAGAAGTAVELTTIGAGQVTQTIVLDGAQVDGVQNVSNNATGGTFTLTFKGQTTGVLAYNAPATGTAAQGMLTMDIMPSNNDTLTVNGKVYTFQTVLTDVDGHVAIGGSLAQAQLNLVAAFSLSGVAGTDYALLTTAHPTVNIAAFVANNAVLTAKLTGTVGNSYGTTETFTAPSNVFDAATLGTTTAGVNGVKGELEKLSNITSVSVTGSGTAGDPWVVTFLNRAAPAMTATSSFNPGETTTITVIEPGESAPIDPNGIAFVNGKLLISDSEIDEEPTIFDDVNMWEITTAGVHLATGLSPDPSNNREPTGLAYDSVNDHVFITNDATRLVYQVDLVDGIYGNGNDVLLATLNTTTFAFDLEDAAYDPTTESLFLATGVAMTVVQVKDGGDGLFNGGDDTVTSIDVSSFDDQGVPGPAGVGQFTLSSIEGIEYRAFSDTLLISDDGLGTVEDAMYEITKDGFLLREFDAGVLKLPGIAMELADIALDPTTDDGSPRTATVYVVDRVVDNNNAEPPPQDGLLYVLSLPFENLSPYVDAGLDQPITLPAAATLNGTVFDDGQGDPATPRSLTTTWTKFSGPGTVTFGNAALVDTTATFSAAGTYVLRLTAEDTELTTFDELTVTVSPAAGGGGGGGGFPPPVTNTFIDDDGNEHEANIEAIAALDITTGCNPPTNDRYCPLTSVNRAQMAAFLIRAIGEEGNLKPYQGYFPDVAEGAWYRPYVERLYELGITTGYPEDGTYRPGVVVNRAQMAVFLIRAFDHVNQLGVAGGVFADVAPGAWYAREVELLYQLGITTGCSANPLSYCPVNPVKRDQMASFLARALGIQAP